MRVVILGAGPCGLTAAWELAAGGMDVTVLEKEDSPGGLCRTFRRNGYQFDMGGHRFISRDRELVESVKGLLGERLLTRERRSAILFPGQRFEYPLDAADILKNGSTIENLSFAFGYLLSAAGASRSGAPEGSFRRWTEERFGKPLYDKFFGPYTQKLWGVAPERLSSEWASSRISVLSALDAVVKAVRTTGGTPRTYAKEYLYPLEGIGAIFEAMAGKVEEHGGRVMTGCGAAGLRREGNRLTSVMAIGRDGESLEVEGDMFLSTIPLGLMAGMLGADAAPPLRHRGLRFLNIMLDGMEDLSPYTWQYTPSADVLMTRLQEPKRRSPLSSPPGKTSAMLEIPCDPDDENWLAPDEVLLEKALPGMERLGYEIKNHVAGLFSTRAEHAYPLLTVGVEGPRAESLKVVGGYCNLSTLGRQGRHRYIFMDEAMVMGRDWARKALANPGHLPDFRPQRHEQEGIPYEAGSVAV